MCDIYNRTINSFLQLVSFTCSCLNTKFHNFDEQLFINAHIICLTFLSHLAYLLMLGVMMVCRFYSFKTYTFLPHQNLQSWLQSWKFGIISKHELPKDQKYMYWIHSKNEALTYKTNWPIKLMSFYQSFFMVRNGTAVLH